MDTEGLDWTLHGKNTHIARDDEYLYIRVPIDEQRKLMSEPSKSGKTHVLATTSGFVKFSDMSVSLNVVFKKEEE
jgi:hypothetical protein